MRDQNEEQIQPPTRDEISAALNDPPLDLSGKLGLLAHTAAFFQPPADKAENAKL